MCKMLHKHDCQKFEDVMGTAEFDASRCCFDVEARFRLGYITWLSVYSCKAITPLLYKLLV